MARKTELTPEMPPQWKRRVRVRGSTQVALRGEGFGRSCAVCSSSRRRLVFVHRCRPSSLQSDPDYGIGIQWGAIAAWLLVVHGCSAPRGRRGFPLRMATQRCGVWHRLREVDGGEAGSHKQALVTAHYHPGRNMLSRQLHSGLVNRPAARAPTAHRPTCDVPRRALGSWPRAWKRANSCH